MKSVFKRNQKTHSSLHEWITRIFYTSARRRSLTNDKLNEWKCLSTTTFESITSKSRKTKEQTHWVAKLITLRKLNLKHHLFKTDRHEINYNYKKVVFMAIIKQNNEPVKEIKGANLKQKRMSFKWNKY